MILERMFARESRAEEVSGGTLTDKGWIASLIAGSGEVSSTGQTVTPWTAEGIPAVYSCQRTISETVGQIPIKLVRIDGSTRQPDLDHPLFWVLHDLANPELTAYHFKEMMTRHLAGWGNAYAEIVRNAKGQVTALWPLMPWRMQVRRRPDGVKEWEYHLSSGQSMKWAFAKNNPPILHLMINSNDGLSGRSPIRVLMDAVGMTQAVNQFGGDFFRKYATPSGILRHPKTLGDKARQHLREQWEEVYGAWGNKHRIAVLQEGMEYTKLSCPPDEAQFIETKGFQIDEMARMYRVPPFMIGHMEKATTWGTGIEQMMLGWLATGLQPYLVAWKQVIRRDCLTQRTFLTHDPVWVERALVRTDFKTRMAGYATQITHGIASPNEVRGWEDLNPRTDEFGDDYMVPINNAVPAALAAQQTVVTVDDDVIDMEGSDDGDPTADA